MRKTDAYRLERIIKVGDQLVEVVANDGITAEDIAHDLHTQWLITTPLYNIGEQAYAVSPEFKEAHPEIPWKAIAGLRHRLVHDYEGTNWSFVAEAVLIEGPALVESARLMLEELG